LGGNWLREERKAEKEEETRRALGKEFQIVGAAEEKER